MARTLELSDLTQAAELARAFVAEGREEIRQLHETGASGRTIVRATSELIDAVVTAVFGATLSSFGAPRGVALAALGGYGRRELAPYSDVDLLLVHDELELPFVGQLAERFFTTLWDARLELGAATRTPAECARIAKEDHTARTALLDCRPLGGDPETYDLLERGVLRGLTTSDVDELVNAKIAELHARRERFGGSVHLLEPNVKQSPGALRDLQAALWMARARFRAAGLSDLLTRGLMPPREVERLKHARDFLWRVRNQLHYLAGKKEDHLSYERQEQVATAFGYASDEQEGLAVERFMRDYYLAADVIRRLADELSERCAPRRARPTTSDRSLGNGLRIWQGTVSLEGNDALVRDPSLFVRLFTTSEELGLPIYPYARDLVREEAARMGGSVRADPRLTEAFCAALARASSGEWIRQLHREGVLGAILPEFGRVTAKHQHDVYHVYTVDVHTVFAMRRLSRLRSGALLDEEPELSHVAREVKRPLALALGVLFHDAGKGLGGNHSEKGAELVQTVCARLGVAERDAQDAVFLVREHLSMSHVSQRRDLSDPELIAQFADRMGEKARLDMLYVLTYVDIASVGPKTWTSWKGRLLHELYEKCAARLRGKSEGAARQPHEAALRGRGISSARVERFLATMPRRYFDFAPPDESFRALRLLEGAKRVPLAATLTSGREVGQLAICSSDRAGLLSDLAGVLAAHRIDILRADVFSTRDGYALDFFVVRGPQGGSVARGRFRAARRDLARVATGALQVESLLARSLRRSGLPARPVPAVESRVRIDNRASARFTIVEVFAQDRPGLLHAVTAALHRRGLGIAVARIATEGHRAVDVFYVADPEGQKLTRPEVIEELRASILESLQTLPAA